jgi:D-alanyl-D-alanine dipeptidase
MIRFSSYFILILMLACGSDPSANKMVEVTPAPEPVVTDESPVEVPVEKAEEAVESTTPSLPSSPRLTSTAAPVQGKDFTDVILLDPSIRLDIRYATTDNFTKSKIYDCPQCLLRPEAAEAVVIAHKALKKKGLGLKMFDCYRPRPYQQRLWDKVPNPDYVTPPAKGSMHSRGAAVDLTIVDANGKELDMGTPYDFFGPEAHTDNNKLPQKVLANRRLLREALEAVGFKAIRTEWWHFSYQRKSWPLSDYVWPCNK